MVGKKSFLLLVIGYCLCLFTTTAQAQSSAVITVGNSSGARQATVTVPVDFNPASDKGVSALSFYLKYNPSELKFKEVKTGLAASNAGKSISVNDKGDGVVRFVIFGLNNTVIAKGVLAEVSFDILSSAAIGSTTVALTNYSASTSEATAAGLVVNNGSIAITGATVALSQENQAQENKIVPEEIKSQLLAQLPLAESRASLGENIIVTQGYKSNAGQSMPQGLREQAVNNLDIPMEIAQPYRQQQTQVMPPVAPAESESAQNKIIEVKSEAELSQPKALEEKIKPEVKITVKPVKWFLMWRSYKLGISSESPVMPDLWELSGKQKLPFLLALNKKNGSMFGIVWGKGEFNLKLNIRAKDKQFIEVPCKLKVE